MPVPRTRDNRKVWLKLGRAVAIGSALSLLLSVGVWAAAWRVQSGGADAQGLGSRTPGGVSDSTGTTGGPIGAPAGLTGAPVVKGAPAPAAGGSRPDGPSLKERLEILDKLLHRGSPNELPTPTLVAGVRGLEKPVGPASSKSEPEKSESGKTEPAKAEPTKDTPVLPAPVKTQSVETEPTPEPASEPAVTPEPGVALVVKAGAVVEPTAHSESGSEGHKEDGPAMPIREHQPALAVPPVASAPQPGGQVSAEVPPIELTLEAPHGTKGEVKDEEEGHGKVEVKGERKDEEKGSQASKDSSHQPKHGGK